VLVSAEHTGSAMWLRLKLFSREIMQLREKNYLIHRLTTRAPRGRRMTRDHSTLLPIDSTRNVMSRRFLGVHVSRNCTNRASLKGVERQPISHTRLKSRQSLVRSLNKKTCARWHQLQTPSRKCDEKKRKSHGKKRAPQPNRRFQIIIASSCKWSLHKSHGWSLFVFFVCPAQNVESAEENM
jgi:hypothetical protein